MGTSQETKGLCPLDPRWGEPPQTGILKARRRGAYMRRVGRGAHPPLRLAFKEMGVWGLRPQRARHLNATGSSVGGAGAEPLAAGGTP